LINKKVGDSIKLKIAETKNNSVKIECKIVGSGIPNDPFIPEVMKLYPLAYYHFPTEQINWISKKCIVYVNSKRTKPADFTSIKNEKAKWTIKEETSEGNKIE